MSTADELTASLRIPTLNNCRALVLSADAELRERLVALLGQEGFRARSTGESREVLQAARAGHCPVVLIDTRVAGTTSRESLAELCAALREPGLPRYVYTLALCEPGDAAAIVAALRAGADDGLDRDASAAELAARLEAARRIASLEQALRSAWETNRRLATLDALTGAYNRRYMARELPREIERARRYARPLAVLACDLDHFKHVNDRHGHAAGDRLLGTFVAEARRDLRHGIDWVARTGGDEFVIVLPETNAEGAHTVAERFRRRLATLDVAHEAATLAVHASFGCAAVETPDQLEGLTAERLLERADAGLYRSKQLGRGRVSHAQPSLARGGSVTGGAPLGAAFAT